MTTFAYKDGVLASDSGVVCAGTYQGSTRKIFSSKQGGMVAVSGDLAALATFKRWVEEKHCKGDVPVTDAAYSAIWIKPNGEVYVVEGDATVQVDVPFIAGGSGMDLATGAMAAGASPEQAVQIAAMFDTGTHGPIQVAKLASVTAELPDNVVALSTKPCV